MEYKFDWDPHKASTNVRKHEVTFRQAAAVFRDPWHLSIYDGEHSQDEDRWVTLGITGEGLLVVVVHTFEPVDKESVSVRIVSARKATSAEVAQYEEVNR